MVKQIRELSTLSSPTQSETSLLVHVSY